MAAMRGPGDHLWQPHLVRGTDYGRTDYGGTIDGMTGLMATGANSQEKKLF